MEEDPILSDSIPSRPDSCYRHPDQPTGVHCTRCGRPICPDCMIQAPVGHQCPTCVAEARAEYRKGPGRQVAIANARAISATKLILAAIGAMFVIEVLVGGPGALFQGPSLQKLVDLGASVGVAPGPFGQGIGIAFGQYWRLFTAIFLHAGLIHAGMNSYALWIFGSVIEPQIGRTRTLISFVVMGLFASAVSYTLLPAFSVGVGASGAIFGLFGIFLVFSWRRRHTAVGAAQLRNGLILLLINAFISFGIPGIDWRAHAGGLVAGIVAGFALQNSWDRDRDKVLFIAGTIALLGVTIAIVLWRTSQLQRMFGI